MGKNIAQSTVSACAQEHPELHHYTTEAGLRGIIRTNRPRIKRRSFTWRDAGGDAMMLLYVTGKPSTHAVTDLRASFEQLAR